MKPFRYLLPCAAVFWAMSCQAEQGSGDPYTSSLLSLDGYIGRESPMVFLIVADDADTMEAAQLRERLMQSLRKGLLHQIDNRWGSCGSNDPAQWHPGDIRIVLARPSAPDGEALLTSVEIPNLAWITNSSKEEEIDAVVAAAAEGLGKRLAMPGEIYRPLRATARAVDLLTGARLPENAAESEFVGTLPKSFTVQVTIGNTRGDEDAAPISKLLPAPSTNENVYIGPYAMVGPSLMGGATCQVYDFGNSRLENWSEQMDAYFIGWLCDDQNTWDILMYDGWVDCWPGCYSRPDVSSEGVAECKVFIDQPNLDTCDADRGWRDPDGKATFANRNGTQLRRCEIVQHTGAKLEACRHSLECVDCGGGFCVTEVPELVPEDYCPKGEVPRPWRFTGGAIAARDAWLTIYCMTGAN